VEGSSLQAHSMMMISPKTPIRKNVRKCII
jgi:hypothetical protein